MKARKPHPSTTLVLGLGNPILGDDGAGWRVAEAFSRRLPAGSPIEVDCISLGGLSLMERMVGYERAVLVDTLVTGRLPLGSVTCFPLDALPDYTTGHTTAAHDTSLATALQVGRQMGAVLPEPEQIWVVGIEANLAFDFSEKLSPAIEAAVPEAVEMVVALVEELFV